MADEIQNKNVGASSEEFNELKPVKGSFKKILSAGVKIAVSGTVIAFAVSLITPPRLMGVTRSARLKYEQRKAEIEKALAEEVDQESENEANEQAAKH